jgi:hypothetical protein
MRWSRPPTLACVVAIVPVSLVATGCGGSPGSPGVASLASPTTAATTTEATTTTQSGPEKGIAPGGPSGGSFRMVMNVGNAADGAKFSACMRKHGVSNFPDPNGQGQISIGSGMGIDPGSPTFRSAQTTCRKLLPNGGQATPQQRAEMQQQMLAYAKCMRAHGIADFPDPNNNGIQLKGGPGSDLNPTNPQFQRAQTACQDKLPGKFSGGLKARVGTGRG